MLLLYTEEDQWQPTRRGIADPCGSFLTAPGVCEGKKLWGY